MIINGKEKAMINCDTIIKQISTIKYNYVIRIISHNYRIEI